MRIKNILLALLLCLVAVNVSAGGDYKAGKIKAYTCTGCHGIVNYNNTYPTYRVPRIGRQNKEYLVNSLQAFKSGEREHKTMNPQTEALSDQDIEDIAVYLAGQPEGPGTAVGDTTEGQNKSKPCHACHGVTGMSAQPIYPNLDGQQKDYLIKTLHSFRDGTRQNAIMNGMAANLSDADIKDITAWYASQKGLNEIKDK
jgi:cytochrome c553